MAAPAPPRCTDGVLVVDKPEGLTSFQVVQQVRRRLGGPPRRAGHTGTLDPLATGVLPVCVGEARKLVQFLVGCEKAYQATARLGVETSTADREGKIVREADWRGAELLDVERACAGLVGILQQRPPAHSAVKRGGERLYEKARRGEHVDVEPREVVVHRITVRRFEPPEVDLEIACGPGTYVRSLCADLGHALGCGAHLVALRRTRVGPFTLDEALRLDEVSADTPLVPMERALVWMATVRLPLKLCTSLVHGVRLRAADLRSVPLPRLLPGARAAVLDPSGSLVAVVESLAATDTLASLPSDAPVARSLRVFGPSDRP